MTLKNTAGAPVVTESNIKKMQVSALSVLVLPADTNRYGFIITNYSSSDLYVAYASESSSDAFTYKLQQNETYESPLGYYCGDVSAVMIGGGGTVMITEIF